MRKWWDAEPRKYTDTAASDGMRKAEQRTMFVNFLSKFTLKTCQKQYWTKSQHTILKFVRKCQTASLNRQSCREIAVVQWRTVVSMEVNQLGTVLEHDRDDGVLYHLAEQTDQICNQDFLLYTFRHLNQVWESKWQKWAKNLHVSDLGLRGNPSPSRCSLIKHL